MFGYVRPARAKLTEEERRQYDAVYCGLCHALGRRYGFLTRFTLTYDFAFLAMLLADPEAQPTVCQKRCPSHPFRRKKGCVCFGGLDLAADESLILTWHKLRDDVADKGFWGGLPARLLSALLRRSYRKVAALCPEFDRQVTQSLALLHRMEEENSAALDRVADAFARILECAAPRTGDGTRDRVLGQLLYHVGRWIYLADAWDDLAEDREQGSYNPLLTRFEGEPEEHLEELRTTMTHSLRLAISAFQLAEFGVYRGVIENTLYLGLPSVQEAVLTGTWREMKNTKEKQHE